MKRGSRVWAAPLLLALLALGGDCGPTQQEIGGGVLLSLPVVFGLVSLVLALLAKWWARILPEVRVAPRQWQVPMAICIALFFFELFLWASRDDDAMELVIAGLLVFGSSYASFALLTFRAVVRKRPSDAFGMSHAAGLLVALPAVFMTLGMVGEPTELFVVGWFYSGGLGLAPLVIGGGLLLEAAHRGRLGKPLDHDTARHFD